MSRRPIEGKYRSFLQGVMNSSEARHDKGFGNKISDSLDFTCKLLDVVCKIAVRLLKVVVILCAIVLIAAFTISVLEIESALAATIIRKLQADDLGRWEWLVGISTAIAICGLLTYKVPKLSEHWCEHRRSTKK